MKKITLLLFMFMALFTSLVIAQEAPGISPETRSWTAIEIVLSIGILVFTLVLILIEAFIISKAEKAWSPASILKVIGLTLIVCMSTFLITAGYNQDQIGPVMGLLGVIAGYLLGEKSSGGSQ